MDRRLWGHGGRHVFTGFRGAQQVTHHVRRSRDTGSPYGTTVLHQMAPQIYGRYWGAGTTVVSNVLRTYISVHTPWRFEPLFLLCLNGISHRN